VPFPPGTYAELSMRGGEFKPFVAHKAVIFGRPTSERADAFTFERKGCRLRVAKLLVYRCEWGGNGGRNRLCG
jgi:hypothetical protein